MIVQFNPTVDAFIIVVPDEETRISGSAADMIVALATLAVNRGNLPVHDASRAPLRTVAIMTKEEHREEFLPDTFIQMR